MTREHMSLCVVSSATKSAIAMIQNGTHGRRSPRGRNHNGLISNDLKKMSGWCAICDRLAGPVTAMSATSAHRARAHLSLVPPVVSPGERTGSDRRAYRRLTVSELAWLEQVRLKYGPLVSLIDLSSGGAQIETTNHRLTPGGALVMQLSGPGTDLAVPARVLRCHVAGIGASTIYRSALEFRQPFEMPSHGDVDGVA